MIGSFREELRREIHSIKEQGLYKSERILTSPQGAEIHVEGVGKVINFCANNYLGLSSHPRVIAAAHESLDRWGYGLSSVRFICGTQSVHRELERKVTGFLGTEDTILYAACFDANGGVFEPFLDEHCAIITDALNHASIIDGIRLTKAKRFIYQHADMQDLEDKLRQAESYQRRLIVTDGVFSMDGDYAPLNEICDLADRYESMVMVDDSHATGFVGETGRGTPEKFGVNDRVDIITTTFGKALGGAMGGCVSGRAELVEWLRQRSRPYLFSNSLSPVVAGTCVAVVDLLSETTELREKLMSNTAYFRKAMTGAGFDIKPGDHPIIPIMVHDSKAVTAMADKLLEKGIFVIGFSYPVVPLGQSRIRVQVSAVHEREHLDRCAQSFAEAAKEFGILK